jgi:hypothetical protein
MTMIGLVPILLALCLVLIPLLSDGPPSLPEQKAPRHKVRARELPAPPAPKGLVAHQRAYKRPD